MATSTQSSVIELEVFPQLENASTEHLAAVVPPEDAVSLPPVDGGKGAWLCLAGCFFAEALTWGFPFAFGVFQEYYSKTPPFSDEPTGIVAIGTTSTGIMYISSIVVFPLLQRFPQYRRHCNIIGFPILTLAMLTSSFATNISQLIATQGVLYGIGGCLYYTPTILFLEEWFVRRRGLAFGIMWAGTGFAGVTVPFFMQGILDVWGYKTALRIWAVVLLVFGAPFIPCLKPRIPVLTDSMRGRKPLQWKFLGSATFWVPQFVNIIQGLGFFIPNLYLPSYCVSIGLPAIVGTIAVAVFNGASVLGTIVVGHLIDRYHYSTVTALITLPSLIAVFICWGFGFNIPIIILFALLYGISAGGFSTTYTGNVKAIQDAIGGDTGVIFGFLAAGRGIGAIASGPLSAALVQSQNSLKGHAGWGYGTEYGSLILFTGCTASVGILSLIARRVGWI